MPALKQDTTLFAAVDLAREAAQDIAEPGAVGEHLGAEMTGERLATHYFACSAPAYPGWRWSVSVSRVSRSKKATVCETSLVPGEGALLAPEWLPYAERIAPGDMGMSDVLPYIEDDPRLEPGFEATGDEDVDQMAFFELGLGRPRVLSSEGRAEAAERWYDGDSGPAAPVAQQAPAPCSSCGFFVPMAGALRSFFGVCANAWSPSDARVVSLDHGCGAHSEAVMLPSEGPPAGRTVLDDLTLDVLV